MDDITPETSVLELAAIISDALTNAGLLAVLSGGGAVVIYTNDEDMSQDLDFVSPERHKDLSVVMEQLSFKRQGRFYKHPNHPFLVEFPSAPLAIGRRHFSKWAEMAHKGRTLQILTPTQCVMDRLAWFYFSSPRDRQAMDQGVSVALKHDVDMEEIKEWSLEENCGELFEEFLKELGKAGDRV